MTKDDVMKNCKDHQLTLSEYGYVGNAVDVHSNCVNLCKLTEIIRINKKNINSIFESPARISAPRLRHPHLSILQPLNLWSSNLT